MPVCVISYVKSEICQTVKTLNPGDVVTITLENELESRTVIVKRIEKAYLITSEDEEICCLLIKDLKVVSRHVFVGLETFPSEPE